MIQTDRRLKWAASVKAIMVVDLDKIIAKCKMQMDNIRRENGEDV